MSIPPQQQQPTVTRDTAPAGPQGEAQPAHEPDEGSVLKNRYQLRKKIGQGGMGVVFEAIDLESVDHKGVVAIKLLKPAYRSPGSRAALKAEVEQTRKFRDDHIVGVYGFEPDENADFMVMEYLNGRPLDKVIAEDYALGMPFEQAWPIILGIGLGLKYAHGRGIVHSDFKPSNAFVTDVGTKVLDFGIARAAGGPIMGFTPEYASCEILECIESLKSGESSEQIPSDPRDDVYAFALVVYELLSGKHPFCNDRGDKTPANIAREEGMKPAPIRGLTRRQQATLAAALRFERSKRTRSIQEVLDKLRREGSAVLRYIVVGLLFMAILGAGGFVGYRWYWPQEDERFVERLINSGKPAQSDADPQTIKEMLELGQSYLDEGVKPLDKVKLSEDMRPSASALGIFQEVLSLEPSNESAARGILAVVKAYEAEADRLYDQHEFKQAAELNEIALRIWRDSSHLNAQKLKIQTKLARVATPAS